MRRAGRDAIRLAAALALLCVQGCGAYAPAHWPDAEREAGGGAETGGETGDEGEESDGA